MWSSVAEQITQLFPDEESAYWFEAYHKSATGQIVKARGALYNHYIYVRVLLREAGIISQDKQGASKLLQGEKACTFFCFFMDVIIHYV